MRTTTYYYEDTTYDECYDMGCIGATIVTIIILVASALLVSLITSVCYCGKFEIIEKLPLKIRILNYYKRLYFYFFSLQKTTTKGAVGSSINHKY